MIEINARELRKVEMRLGGMKKRAPTAIARTLNRVVSTTKTNINKETRKRYVIKARDINATMSVRKANSSFLSSTITSRGERIPLDKFKFSPKQPRPKNPPKALNVSVKKDGIKKLLHAFVANINSNKIFERAGKARLPIERLFGPAVPQMVKNEEIRNVIELQAVEQYNKRLDHEIRYIRGNI